MEETQKNFDEEIADILEATFQAALIVNSTYTPEQIKLMIVATNLKSVAKTFLLADQEPDKFSLNLKKLALGILGTSDWIEEGLEKQGIVNR